MKEKQFENYLRWSMDEGFEVELIYDNDGISPIYVNVEMTKKTTKKKNDGQNKRFENSFSKHLEEMFEEIFDNDNFDGNIKLKLGDYDAPIQRFLEPQYIPIPMNQNPFFVPDEKIIQKKDKDTEIQALKNAISLLEKIDGVEDEVEKLRIKLKIKRRKKVKKIKKYECRKNRKSN